MVGVGRGGVRQHAAEHAALLLRLGLRVVEGDVLESARFGVLTRFLFLRAGDLEGPVEGVAVARGGLLEGARVEGDAGFLLGEHDGGSRRDVLPAVSMGGGSQCWERRTNDRLYESKDSREMLNGSFSLKTLRWLLLVVLRDEDVQKLRLSFGGDGGMNTPESLISARLSAGVCQASQVPAHTAQLVLGRLFLLDVDGLGWSGAIGLVEVVARGDRPRILVLLAKQVPHDWHLDCRVLRETLR